MNRTKLAKILCNSTFAEVTIPYKIFVNEDKRLLAVANSFFPYWSGGHSSMSSISLLLYNLDTLELISFVDDLAFEINDLAFHPNENIIAFAIGSYDGGAFYEGELLVWNYKTKELNSILKDNREVTKCEFRKDGNKLVFTVNPTDDIDYIDFNDKEYELEFPVLKKIELKSLKPISITFHEYNKIEDYHSRVGYSENVLAYISKEKDITFYNRHLILNIVFISEQEIAIARNNNTIEIWNTETEESKEIILPENGECVELFFNSTNNSLLVNLLSRNNLNELFSINLLDLAVQKIISCSHKISKNKENYFFARKVNYLNKTEKDFILNPSYQIIFEKSCSGNNKSFQDYLKIDNSEFLYFCAGNPNEQYKNISLYSINPQTFEIKEVWQIEEQPNKYHHLNGIKNNDDLILSGLALSSDKNLHGAEVLFCIDLTTKKEKWLRTVCSKACSFGIVDNGATIVLSMTNGQIELIESTCGKTIEIISRINNQTFARPLSLATSKNKIVAGITNGQIEIYNRSSQ